MPTFRFVACAVPLVIVALAPSGPVARADTLPGGISRHGSVAVGRSDSDEVALARTAGPTSLSAGAAVYVLRDGEFSKVRDGSSGWACMVSRDTKANGVFPMCFDPEATQTLMAVEMMRTKLRTRGLSNTAVEHEVEAAYKRGTLHYPEKPAMIYMMSSKQVLMAYQGDKVQRVGAWHPHVMIYLPHASAGQFALGADDGNAPVSAPFSDAGGVQLVVEVPQWADSPTATAAAGGGGSR
jgi:hypothetical protein